MQTTVSTLDQSMISYTAAEFRVSSDKVIRVLEKTQINKMCANSAVTLYYCHQFSTLHLALCDFRKHAPVANQVHHYVRHHQIFKSACAKTSRSKLLVDLDTAASGRLALLSATSIPA